MAKRLLILLAVLMALSPLGVWAAKKTIVHYHWTETVYDPRRPYASGWGWWLFNPSQIYDDHIAWTADYLPAGTYELTYTLVILQAGEYHVLPPRAWQLYFPEVQANGSGAVFEIKP